MRIYAVADIHARPERMERILLNIRRYQPDVLVVAGDITAFFHPAKLLHRLNRLPVPVLLVRGNSDLKRVDRLAGFFGNISSLHLRRVRVGKTVFSGISGTLPLPFRTRLGLREARLVQEAGRLVDKDSVLVVHPPPYGVLDRVMGRVSAGSRAVAELISDRQPRLVLCGHIHEAYGKARLGRTWIVNCNVSGRRQGAMVDLAEASPPGIWMLPPGARPPSLQTGA
jgi:hypothetical protein